MRCKSCGKEIRESASFCIYCGADVLHAKAPSAPSTPLTTHISPAKPTRCKNCGEKIQENASFCIYCGEEVLYEAVPEVPLTPPAALTPPVEPTPIVLPVRAADPLPEPPVKPEAVAQKISNKQLRIQIKKVLLGAAYCLLIALVVLLLVLSFSKGKSDETSASAGASLSGQLEQAQTWQEYYEIGQTHQKQQNYESAIAAFEAALALDETNSAVRLALAESYAAAEQFESALAEYETLAETGATPYYEERTQCYLALKQPEKAGQMLHAAYVETGDETITALEQKYWNTDALHAYGEYVGYDGNYAFGLFDWNHDLTPELMYVYNASDYGNTAGASVELWTYQNGEMMKLYVGSTAYPGVSLTADDSIFVVLPVTNGYYLKEQLYWDGNEVTVHSFLDCYLDGYNFAEYELHPEFNYFWGNETKPRGSFVENVQVSYEQYEQTLEQRRSGAESILYWPVTRENCKTYLGFDWAEILPVVAEAYHLEMRPELTVDQVQHVFDPMSLGNGDMITEPIQYGAYAIVRDDSEEDVLTFAIPFGSWNKWEYFYTEDKTECTVANDHVLFQPWFGPGCACCFVLNPADNSIRELPPGEYTFEGKYLIRRTVTFDVYSSKTLQLFDSDGNSIAVLLENVSIPNCIIKGNVVYLTGIQNNNLFFNGSDNSISPIDIWRFSLDTKEKEYLTTVIAASIKDVTEDSISYTFSYFGDSSKIYTVKFGAEADAQAGPDLTKTFDLNKDLYPRPERTLKAGMGGEDVKYVQALLISMNYDVPKITGGFDEITEGSVIAWQKRHGYEQTGIVDAQTLCLMEEAEQIWREKQGR